MSGTLIGVSDWVEITQQDTTAFGQLTRSSERLHDDPDWAACHSPFGTTIAHGFQTLSLLTAFLADVRPWRSRDNADGTGTRVSVNYGFDRVRFLAPVQVGVRIRGRFKDGGARDAGPGRQIVRTICTVEIEGVNQPALVADWLGMVIEDIDRQETANAVPATL